MDKLENLVSEARVAFDGVTEVAQLDQVKARFLGKSGVLAELRKGLAALTPEERPKAGARFNEVKGAIERLLGTVYSTPVGSVKLRARVEELGGEILSADDEQWSVAELRHHALRAFNKANGTAYLVEDPDENNDNPLCLLDHDYYRD